MGKRTGKKSKASRRREEPRRYLRVGALAALVAVGAGAMLGMALFNRNAKPNRDMQWYMKAAAVETTARPANKEYAAQVQEPVLKAPVVEESTEPVQPERQAYEVAETAADETSVPVKVASGETATEETAEGTPDAAESVAEAPASDETATDAAAEETPDAVEAVAEAPASGETATEDIAEETPDAVEAVAEAPTSGETATEETPEAVQEVEEPEEIVYEGPVTLTITAAGDCTFGGQDGAKGKRRFTKLAKENGYDYFFEGVRSIFEGDDLTIVNLEGPLTTVSRTSRQAKFIFRGDPEYVNILTGSSVELCNLANNHSRDYGMEGLQETADVLDAAGVGYCGFSKAYYTTIKGVRVGSLGFTWWDYDARKIVPVVEEARKNCDLLIVSMHWGTEYDYDYSYLQQDLAYAIIDAGADLLIGTHPHVIQGIEKYKGKYILYSLGNFCFGGNANPSDKRCLVFQQTFSFTPGLGIAQAGIMDEGINLIPVSISSTKEYNDFQPTVMDAQNGAKVLKSVANHSDDLKLEDVKWMQDNYMIQNGLISSGEDGEAETAMEQAPEAGEAEAPEAEADETNV